MFSPFLLLSAFSPLVLLGTTGFVLHPSTEHRDRFAVTDGDLVRPMGRGHGFFRLALLLLLVAMASVWEVARFLSFGGVKRNMRDV